MRSAAVLLWMVLAAAALPAQAQAPSAGAIFDHRGQEPPDDEDEPDTAAEKPLAPQAEPEPQPVVPPSAPTHAIDPQGLPAAPIPYAPPPRSQLTRPVHIDETGKTPDGPPTVRDQAYDSRIRSSFASAQGFQGPLDGGWTLAVDGAGDLYSLQIVDRRDRLEGVWRDVRRKGALTASGLVDDIQRDGADLTLRFTPEINAPEAVAVLHDRFDGRWAGELSEGGQKRAVTLRRTGP